MVGSKKKKKRRKLREAQNPRQICCWERDGRGDVLYILKWVWVPQLREMVGLKTWVSGPQIDSTKKAKLIGEISSFQKVYILRVSGTSKFGHRFGVKRLFCPWC